MITTSMGIVKFAFTTLHWVGF